MLNCINILGYDMVNLFDAHFHLDYYKNYKSIYRYLDQHKYYTLCMTTAPGIYASCQSIFSTSKYIRFALGFHPLNHELKDKDFDDFIKLFYRAKYIGEVGLDFSAKKCISYEKQLYYFERIVKMCTAQNKLMSIHIKKAEGEAIEIIKKYKPSKCIIHWFSGSDIEIEELIRLGCYFSVNTNMLYSKNGISCIQKIPIDKFFIESDGPFTKVNGKIYEPTLLLQVYNDFAYTFGIKDLDMQIFNNLKSILR